MKGGYVLANKKWNGDYSKKGNDAVYRYQIRDAGDNYVHARIECNEYMAEKIINALNKAED